jgi:hypothetical protein
VAHVSELCFGPAGLLEKPLGGIGKRLVRIVLSLLLVPVNGWIVARIAWQRVQDLVIVLLSLEPLLPRPGLDQRPVDSEVFIAILAAINLKAYEPQTRAEMAPSNLRVIESMRFFIGTYCLSEPIREQPAAKAIREKFAASES